MTRNQRDPAGSSMRWLAADWPAPSHVVGFTTTRLGGLSRGCYVGLNLGLHVDDEASLVQKNRALVASCLPSPPVWLEQVHGIDVVDAAAVADVPQADAAFTTANDCVAAVMTADCLPVLFTNRAGTVVAAAHAGWRGLAAGVLEATVAKMAVPSDSVIAWLGPALGPCHFEVGADVLAAFAGDEQAFVACNNNQGNKNKGQDDKWWADIFMLARLRLQRLGVVTYGGGQCTYSQPSLYYSHRRATHHGCATGRMLSGVYLKPT